MRLGGPVSMGGEKAAGASESHGASAEDVDALVRKHMAKGFRAAYAPKVRLPEPDGLRQIRESFEAPGIMMARDPAQAGPAVFPVPSQSNPGTTTPRAVPRRMRGARRWDWHVAPSSLRGRGGPYPPLASREGVRGTVSPLPGRK